ncbi:MAG: chemotaxis protein CheB [Nitrospirota bacterium]
MPVWIKEGITHIKRLGGITIAQDKKSSAIYNMPMEAEKTGNVDIVLPPEKIVDNLIELVGTIH